MNKKQLEGYLLAHYDHMMWIVKDGKLDKDDVGVKVAKKIKQYIDIVNSNSECKNSIYLFVGDYEYSCRPCNKRTICPYCGQETHDSQYHVCYQSSGTAIK